MPAAPSTLPAPAAPRPTPPAELPAPAPGPRCANCGTPADDAYCPHCGQEQHDLHRSLRALFGEALDGLAGWDGKIPATLWLLVSRPGALTVEFLGGRRARYLRPLRLYLTLSLVYFLALQLDWGSAKRTLNLQMSGPVTAESRRDSIETARRDSARAARAAQRTAARAAVADSLAASPREGDRAGRIERLLDERKARLDRIPKAERNRVFTDAFFGQLPNMVFALVPLFALLLKLVYRRAPLYYAEHLVHALHLHAFAMLVMTAVHFTPGAWSVLPFLALPAHAWLSMRRVHGGSRARTTAKLTLVLGGYLTALTLALAALAGVIVFFVIAR
jgi:hypothetical protein